MMPSRRGPMLDDQLILPARPPAAKRCPVCKAFGSERMQHASQCPLEPVYCENKCGVKVSRRLLQEHRTNDCTKRLVPCPYCRKEFVFDTLKNHIPKCPRYLVQCHQCETTKIPREDLEHHLKDFCPAAAVGCVFKDLGCKFKGSQFALDQHLEESSKSHLGLLCGIVSRQQQQISALRTALHGLVANTTGTLLWKISDYSHKMAEAKAQEGGLEICSPPFSTSPYGYRLMATLFLNGNGSGESTHLSVYIKLLPGEYDSLLPWPFAHTVSFALLDQPSTPEKACHIVESFVPDPTWKNFQRPSREPDALGFGFPRFVSHEMLKKCHYIRDNAIFIKVTVDESKIIAV
ncbi:TNF receptor associated factor 4 isoform X1 [Amblyomma americanum]